MHACTDRCADCARAAQEVGKQRTGGVSGHYGTASRVLFKEGNDELSQTRVEQRGQFNKTDGFELTPTKPRAQQEHAQHRPRVPRQADPWHGGLNGSSPLASPAMLEASPAFERGARPHNGAADANAQPGSSGHVAAYCEEAHELDLEFAPIRAKIQTHMSLFNDTVELQNCSSSVVAGMEAEMKQVIDLYNKLDTAHSEMLFQSNKKQRCLAIARDAFAKIEAIAAEQFQPEANTEHQSPAAAHQHQGHAVTDEDQEREAQLAYAPTQALI